MTHRQAHLSIRTMLVLIFLGTGIFAQAQVTNTSFRAATGEKILRFEFVVPVNAETAWQWFTTDVKLRKWIAPVTHTELRTGGYILTNYDSSKSLSDHSSIRLPIINFIENELLTLKVDLNEKFTQTVIDEDQNLQEIIQFKPIDSRHTKIISSMVGWGSGTEWEKPYDIVS